MAASLNAAPVGEFEAGRLGAAAPDAAGAQKPIALEVPNADATGPVPPSGVIAAFADAGEAPASGEVGTGDVVTGNVASGDIVGGDAVAGDVTDESAGKVPPAALNPFVGQMVMLPNAGACAWPRPPV